MPKRVHRPWRSALRVLRESASGRASRGYLDLAITERWGMWPDRSRNPLTAGARRYWSQSDEDGILERILARVLPDAVGTFLEFGVGDGTENNTAALLSRGWSGGWAGAQPLAFEPHEGGRLAFRQAWLTLDTIGAVAADLLSEVGEGDPDVISIDVDGNDYHLCEHLLESGLRPSVWVAEVNGRFPLDARWIMPYDPDHVWNQDDYYGASFAAMCDLFEGHGYHLVACSVTGVNAFFIRTDHLDDFPDVPRARSELHQPPLPFIPGPLAHPASAATLRSLTGRTVARP